MRYISGKEPDNSMCYFIFNSGKKIGKIFGLFVGFALIYEDPVAAVSFKIIECS